jgi:hypothetical protein
MKSLRESIFVLLALASAVLLTASALVQTPPAKGVGCKTSACTYYDANNKGFTGSCGAIKGDEENCYCIATVNKKTVSQRQSACSLPR